MEKKPHLITASLLNAWKYLLESEYSTMDSFLEVLNKVSHETTKAQQAGYDFEDWCIENYEPTLNGQYQVKLSKEVTINGIEFCLYGRLDCLKQGVVYDYKHTSKYEVGKFFGSYQTSMYLELVPEASKMVYVIGTDKPQYQVENENDVYNIFEETYTRDECKPIIQVIKQFIEWLKTMGLWQTYLELW